MNALREVGLSERESKVYLALLELGSTSTGPLVKKSGVPNCKIYETLEKLIKKGLASYILKTKVKQFQAAEPEVLLTLLEERKKRVEELLPELKLKQELAQEQQEATIYEGYKGVKTAFEDILNTLQRGEEYYVFTLGEELKETKLKRFFSHFHLRRIEKGIKARLIVPRRIKQLFQKQHKYTLMNVRYHQLQLPTGIFIYGNKVMTFIWGEQPSAYVISSRRNAEHYRNFFEEMWQTMKE